MAVIGDFEFRHSLTSYSSVHTAIRSKRMHHASEMLPGFRWRIAVLVAAAIAISYLDRQTLPVAIKAVQRDIAISNEQFSLLNTAFLLTYGIMYVVGGRAWDFIGTRKGFARCMVFWSLACASRSLA